MTKKRGKKKITLKKLAVHDTLWHEDSRLVFKSKTQKLVVGMLEDDDKSIVVNDETLDLCEKWGFKIDPALVESESDDDDDEKKEEKGAPEVSEPKPRAEPKPRSEPKPRADPKKVIRETECAVLPPKNVPLLVLGGADAPSAVLDALAAVSKNVSTALHNLESKVVSLTAELTEERKARGESDEKLERIRRQFFD